jgi:hypothetical protein
VKLRLCFGAEEVTFRSSGVDVSGLILVTSDGLIPVLTLSYAQRKFTPTWQDERCGSSGNASLTIDILHVGEHRDRQRDVKLQHF